MLGIWSAPTIKPALIIYSASLRACQQWSLLSLLSTFSFSLAQLAQGLSSTTCSCTLLRCFLRHGQLL